jgi:hypothetical protein
MDGGEPLPFETRAAMEQRFGFRFDHVRIHADDEAGQYAAAVNARAYTVGTRIMFGPGQYAPNTATGKLLLAHELAHVVQQGGGAIRTTAGIPVSASSTSAERSADRAAMRVLEGTDARPSSPLGLEGHLLGATSSTPILQRKGNDDVDPFDLV